MPFPGLHSRQQLLAALALACALLLAGCATTPTEYQPPPALSASERTQHNARVFDRTWELVNRHYFDAAFRGVDWPAMRARYRPEAVAATDDTALYRVLNRLLAELKESHLSAASPRQAHERRTEHRAAVGIRMQTAAGQRVVVEVVPDSPAERAGVHCGWIVTARNGAPIRDDDPPFHTRVGEAVTFDFLNQADEPVSLTMQPELLNFDRFESRELAGGVRYLRFDEFNRQSLFWLSRQLKQHRAAPAVILDLRQNGGGTTFVLRVALAEFFERTVPAGKFVTRSGRANPTAAFGWLPARYAGRVVVLTGPASGSSSEILAHVLQHNGRATIVGRKTAGAVILSRLWSLPGGGRLQVPIQDYVGLDGQRLEGRGVTPDVLVPEPTLAELRACADRDLAAALELLR